jgi:uncharacterized protein (UPF0548 family)
MLSLRKPSPEAIRCYLAAQAKLEFTYTAVGATAHEPPNGYVVDHTRVHLGEGDAAFKAARRALEQWEQFRLGWLEAWPADTPIRAGETVAILARVMRVWCLNASRIVYVRDETGPVQRFGFAYGTLPDHVESGEERFAIEWDRESNRVSYDVLAFSRPRHLLTRLGYRLVRRLQRRFGKESSAAMLRAVCRDESGVAAAI